MSRIGLLITARLKSTRLPLKVLNELGGSEIVAQVIRRAKQVHGVSDVILCTSLDPQDAPLVRLAAREGVLSFNGHPDDVLLRLRDAAKFYGLDAFVSITADNPFFCVHHANRVVDLLNRKPETDYIYIEGLPIGTAVYGLSTAVVCVANEIKQHTDTEIWGPFVNRPELFNVQCLSATPGYDIAARLTIDEPADYSFAVQLVTRTKTDVSRLTLPEVGAILDDFPALSIINSAVQQRPADPNTISMLDTLFQREYEFIRQCISSYRRVAS